MKKNFNGKKWLIVISKSLLYVTIPRSEGGERKILGGHNLAFVMDAFYMCPLILKSIFGRVHVIVLKVKTCDMWLLQVEPK